MSTNELIKNLNNGDNVNASKQFNTIMADKMTAAMDARKIEIASSMNQREADSNTNEE
tara:strand:- start:257 stop:430 length:174 start_codon:yes stop_codon:yes gene_type:complete